MNFIAASFQDRLLDRVPVGPDNRGSVFDLGSAQPRHQRPLVRLPGRRRPPVVPA